LKHSKFIQPPGAGRPGRKQLRIPGREVARGDTVMIREGDRIQRRAHHFLKPSVDESLLTGESVPVLKDEPHRLATQLAGRERQRFAAFIIRGKSEKVLIH
jgi:Ca2+-transporting ATPase